jgi:hypothetical protein
MFTFVKQIMKKIGSLLFSLVLAVNFIKVPTLSEQFFETQMELNHR